MDTYQMLADIYILLFITVSLFGYVVGRFDNPYR